MESKQKDKILKNVKQKISISSFLEEERIDMKIKSKNLVKSVAVAACTLIVATGVVFASSKVVEIMFKNPKKYESYEDMIEDTKEAQGSQEVTQEDEQKAVDMEEAIVEANKLLNKLGYENQEFVRKDLKKNYIMGAELVYYLTSNQDINRGVHVGINAENGRCVDFSDHDLKYQNLKTDEITKEQAMNRSNEIYKIFGLKPNEYKLKKIEESQYGFHEMTIPHYWRAEYCKTYDGVFNQFERFEVQFVVVNGKTKLFSAFLANQNIEFNNNEIVLTKEEAKEIALEEDKKLTDNEIDFVVTNLEIRQVNSWIYLLEQNGGKYPEPKQEILNDGTVINYPEYQINQNKARKVWTVNIHYKKGEFDPNNENKYHTKSIFIDVTTGEIVGGADESYWEERD